MNKTISRILALLLLALPLFIVSAGCDQAREFFGTVGMTGEDGSDGAAGPVGLPGNTGAAGEHGLVHLDPALDPPDCDQCIGNTSFEDGAVGSTVQVDVDAVMAADFAPGAIGTDEIADGSVGRAHLKNGAVTGIKIMNDQITMAKLGPDAALPGNFAAASVLAGNIAPGAVDTQHFILGAVNRTWTVTGQADTQITPGQSWTPLLDLSMTLDGATGGPYLALFDASFFAQTAATVSVPPTPMDVRLVMIYNGTNTVVLDSRPLGFISTGNPAVIRYNDLGHVALHWAGSFNKASYPLPHKFEVQWRSNLLSGVPAQDITIEQRAADGTRALTVIEFTKAAATLTVVP